MIGTVFRSQDVPAADRLEHWRQTLDRIRPSDVTSTHGADFRAEGRLMEMGPVTVLPVSFMSSRYRRSAKAVRRSDPQHYHLTLLLQGEMGLEHAGHSATLRPDSLHLVDSSQPFNLSVTGAGPDGHAKGIGVDLPKSLLPLPPHRIRGALGQALPGREGAGALLTEFLLNLHRQADTLRPSDAPRLGTVVLDLLSTWLTHLLDARSSLPPQSRRTALLRSVLAFAQQNLHDPELSPSLIAAAHHISLSYLHKVFQEQMPGQTVAAWIRDRRLDGARRDLADPALRHTPVHSIALRWGLPDASGFNRAFRTAYGLPPGQYRRRALSGGA
ncbi:helix-turn-helix domain-containing protein [Streptomyces sp. NPDC001606]